MKLQEQGHSLGLCTSVDHQAAMQCLIRSSRSARICAFALIAYSQQKRQILSQQHIIWKPASSTGVKLGGVVCSDQVHLLSEAQQTQQRTAHAPKHTCALLFIG